jgi:CRISPR-associated endonuclease/helicase Cas3
MSEYIITLNPVYSCPASEIPDEINLPENWQLAWHQAETVKAIRDPNINIIFNTAMTGDGKSLAAYLPVLTSQSYTLAMYPTNELARDQEKQVNNYKGSFNPKYDPQIYRLNASILEDFIASNRINSKLIALIDRADNSEILLTNPDIFHYIHDFRYLRRNKQGKGDKADRLFSKIDRNYQLFLFDEFHVFSSPQITSVLNAILLMKHTVPNKKFLFLSATPSELLQDFLVKSGLKYTIIDPIKKNKYSFCNQPDWRQINQPIALYFPKDLAPNMRSSYDWIIEHKESVILKFFQDYPGSKGAIILNSIASIKKLLPYFKAIFEPLGLKVRENTGLTGETEKSKSVEEADLLLGTSTIDVGVDFRINFLIFEAADAGNFIQRFGRLGRHLGFDVYRAYALLPNFIVERLFEGEKPPLTDNQIYDKINFYDAIRQHYGYINEFKKYPQRWGSIQSACVYSELLRLKHDYPSAYEGFGNNIQQALNVSVKKKFGQIQHCIREGKQKVVDEARSFRGSSQLNCAIYDLSNPNEPEQERFKTYNLPSLISNFVYEWLDKGDFLQRAKSAGITTTKFEQCLCYLKITGYREIRENWHFYYPGRDLGTITKSGKVQVLKGLEVNAGINQISRALSKQNLVCYISDYERSHLRKTLGLPIHFQAYALSNRMDDKKPPYTIAFGQSALLLETLIWYWKPKEDDLWIC